MVVFFVAHGKRFAYCGHMDISAIASSLGKLGHNKPKRLTQEERQRRRLAGAQRLREWHLKQGHKVSEHTKKV